MLMRDQVLDLLENCDVIATKISLARMYPLTPAMKETIDEQERLLKIKRSELNTILETLNRIN